MSIAMPFNQSGKIKDIHKLQIDFFFFKTFKTYYRQCLFIHFFLLPVCLGQLKISLKYFSFDARVNV